MRMVERVARALCEAAEDDWDWSIFYIVEANDTAETGRDVYRDMARAAIEAMRQPDDAMRSVFIAADWNDWPAESAFVVAIDKALESGE